MKVKGAIKTLAKKKVLMPTRRTRSLHNQTKAKVEKVSACRIHKVFTLRVQSAKRKMEQQNWDIGQLHYISSKQ